jgi:hypothetical protein
MVETPSQPRHAAELALIAGFILLLLLEAFLFRSGPGAGPVAQSAPPGATGATIGPAAPGKP